MMLHEVLFVHMLTSRTRGTCLLMGVIVTCLGHLRQGLKQKSKRQAATCLAQNSESLQGCTHQVQSLTIPCYDHRRGLAADPWPVPLLLLWPAAALIFCCR